MKQLRRTIRGIVGGAAVTCGAMLFLSLAAVPRTAWAENNTDYIFNGTTTNFGSFSLPVSSPGTNNSLQVLNGGAVGITNGDLTIGVFSGDNNNYVLVSGTNLSGVASSLVDTNALFSTIGVGSGGAANQLIVTNGAQAIGGRFIIGFFSSSTGNTVTVTGSNSLLNARDGLNTLNLGWSGGLNQLLISDGGRVNNTIANVGSVSASASNNMVVVSGTGSVWSNSSTFNFGQGSAGNSLIISSGGRVDVGGDFNSYNGLANNTVLVTGSNSLLSLPSSAMYMSGDNALWTIADGGRVVASQTFLGYTDHTNNVAIVTGPGSIWSNSTLAVGHFQGSGVQLIVTNGGLVASTHVTLGNLAASRSNSVLVTGSNSLMNLTGTLTVGNNGGFNQLTIRDDGRVNSASTKLGLVAGTNSIVIASGGRLDTGSLESFTDNNSILVTGSNSQLNSVAGYVQLGANNTSMTISDGAKVTTANGYFGSSSGGTNSVVTVTGSNSEWNIASQFYAGQSGMRSLLVITNGGRVNDNQGFVSFISTAGSNTVIVTGSNSVWNNTSDLFFGYAGNGRNQLIITDGGRVNNNVGYVGYNAASAISNTILVSGAGSAWSNASSVRLGFTAGGNALTIANGGRVDASFLESFTDDNSVVVTGSNSLFSAPSGYLQLGANNTSLTIADGGQVVTTDGYFGSSPSGTNVVVTVGGTNSKWTMSGTFYAGQLGKQNSLIITNGGRVDVNISYISFGTAAGSNTVIVTGSNSLWNLNSHLYVGYQGNGSNQLIIADGGRVKNNIGYVGYNVASVSNNSILVTGAGSTWTNVGSLNLGYVAGGNLLTIANGGRVDSADASVGVAAGATPDNRVVVTGSNSLWSMAGGLGIGGHNAQVTIADGGQIISSDGYIGNGNSTSTNVSVVITGADARWTVSSDLNVGWLSSGTSLTITNGARADSNRGWIGRFGPSSNNLATVTGSNSLWNITSDLFFANGGPGSNRLVIADGGRVKNATAYIGYGLSGSNNSVLVTGAGSVWTNTGSINLGENAGGNLLTITDGGRVDADGLSIGGSGGVIPDNRLLVTGNGSLLSARGFGVGIGGHNAQATVSGGGRIVNSDGYVGNGLASATNVTALVTGAGSLWSNTASLNVGWTASKTSLVITNGGTVHAGQTFVGRLAGSTNNSVIVSGAGSMFQHRLQLVVGTAGAGSGAGTVTVADGGTIESPVLISGSSGSGTISNRGGIYQFTTATPTVTPNTAGTIMMTNGTISYRGVTGADINNAQVGNISKSGNNGFRLNNSSNAVVAGYTFDSIANTGNPTNYQRLSLINNARWTSANLTIGTGGGLTGGAGDVVEITQNFTIQRNVNTGGEFDLSTSTVLFSGNTGHTNAITGDDFGHNGVVGNPDGFTAQNFAYGKLSLGSSSDTICFQCGEIPVAPSNALYVVWLDLLGDTNLVANLHAPSTINIYYFNGEPNNAYLNNNVYQLTDCNGGVGGLLMPAVPEPSSLLLLSVAACAIFWRKSRQA